MPNNPKLEPKHHSFRLLFGQRPLTKFTDYRRSIKVDLIKYDDPETMLDGTFNFVKATWSEDGRESERASKPEKKEALKQMLSGKALGLGLETVNFMFRISGISRIDTHQIVRQRIGVTFSQQCTGDRMLHHNTALVEECIAQDDKTLDSFIKSTIMSKQTYADMIDRGISIQAARSILPHNLSTFIFMNVNLMTLLFFYSKRIDDGSQTWQINEISRQMEAEVCKIYPDLQEVFDKHKTSFKFQAKAGADMKNTFSTSLYKPKVDEYDYNLRDFLYDKTKEEMHFTDLPIEDTFYWGDKQVSKVKFNEVKKAYEELDQQVSENHWSNDEIKLKAITITNQHE